MDKKAGRELKTLEAMIKLYCKGNHRAKEIPCFRCRDLYNYAGGRIVNCKLGVQKTTCIQCSVHCFKADFRDRIKTVMRYSGPKMIYKHPILAIYHILDRL